MFLFDSITLSYTVFFSSHYCRNEDLKQMLESNKDSAKLDAMRRIVGVCDTFFANKCCCWIIFSVYLHLVVSIAFVVGSPIS